MNTQTRMRRFVLSRREDVSGVSETGIVAEGVVFSTGQATLCWLSHLNTVGLYHSIDVVQEVHGHGGCTIVEFLDPPMGLGVGCGSPNESSVECAVTKNRGERSAGKKSGRSKAAGKKRAR